MAGEAETLVVVDVVVVVVVGVVVVGVVSLVSLVSLVRPDSLGGEYKQTERKYLKPPVCVCVSLSVDGADENLNRLPVRLT